MYLIGEAHLAEHECGKPHAHCEPTRALLFPTWARALEWCRAKRAIYRGRTDVCAKWRWRPVRVVESVKVKPAILRRKLRARKGK